MLDDRSELNLRRAHVQTLIGELNQISEELYWDDSTSLRILQNVSALNSLLFAAGMGECRLDQPYTALEPILDSNGLRWCCRHNPQHCSP